jgi:hypothetical protein
MGAIAVLSDLGATIAAVDLNDSLLTILVL